MDIPTGEISSDFYAGRVQRIVNLQRRWQGWVQHGESNPPTAASRPTSAVGRHTPSLAAESQLKRRPLSAASSGPQQRRRVVLTQTPTLDNATAVDTSNKSLADLSAFSSQLQSGEFQRRNNHAPTVVPISRSPASAQNAGKDDLSISGVDDAHVRLSHFGVSVDEVAALKKVCDALKQLELCQASTGIVDPIKLPSSGCEISEFGAPTLRRSLSVEICLSALEAVTHVFSGHPLFQYLFATLASWLPRGVYTNALPLLAEAAPLPLCGVGDVVAPSNVASVNASRVSHSAGGAVSRPAQDNWVDWLVNRSQQWSHLCIPLGATASMFDVAGAASDSNHRPSSVSRETFGQTLFSNTVSSSLDKTQPVNDPSPSLAVPGHRSSVVASALQRLTSTAPRVPKKVILRQNFLAWSDFVSKRSERRKWIRVASKSAHKDTLYLSFFKWKCETSISLALRKTSHAERLHYVVQDDAKRIQALEADVRNVTRQRDGALARVDQLMDESKLAFVKTRDLQNNMVIDFRQPLYAINSRRTTITATAASSDPLVCGVIYFQAQPAVSAFQRSIAPHDDHQSTSSVGGSANGSTSSPRPLPLSASTSQLTLPIVYKYDCGAERDVDGVAMPGAEHYRSHYHIAVEGLTEKQAQAAPLDPLLSWVNDTVIEACGMLMGFDPSPPSSPMLGATASPQQSSARAARIGAANGSPSRPRRTVIQDFDAFGDLGDQFKEYLAQWQAKCQSWDTSSNTLRDASMSDHPVANRCVVSADSRSKRLAPSVQLACHVSRPRDLSSFPFIYVLILYRVCPTLIQLYGPSLDDSAASALPPTIHPVSADDWAAASGLHLPSSAHPLASSLSLANTIGSPFGSISVKPITVEEQVAILVRKSMKSIDALYPLLHRAGLVQHLPLDLLAPYSNSVHDASAPTNPKASDATHRLLAARLHAFSNVLGAYQPFWEHHMKGAPFHRALSLQDVVIQRHGADHATEVVLQEILAWVRSVLNDSDFAMPETPHAQVDDGSETTTAANRNSTVGSSMRHRPPELPSRSQSNPPISKGASSPNATVANTAHNGFSHIANLSENFGEGLELLWLLVWRLAPPNSLPMMHAVVDELRKPPPTAPSLVVDPLSTSMSSPAASLRSPMASPQNGAATSRLHQTSPSKGAARESPKAVDGVVKAKLVEHDDVAPASSPLVPSEDTASDRVEPLPPPSVDALPIKYVAHLLCVTLRDVFGGHVPPILEEELYLATPSMKAMYLNCLYSALHDTKPKAPLNESNSADEASKQEANNSKQATTAVSKKGGKPSASHNSPQPAASPTASHSNAPMFVPSGPGLFPNCSASMATARALADIVDSCAPAAMKATSLSPDELLALFINRNETLFILFLKYATLGAPPLRVDALSPTLGGSNGGHISSVAADAVVDVDISQRVGNVGLSFVAVELLARDILCAFVPPRAGPPAYLAASGEESSNALMAVRRAFFETLGLDPLQLPHQQPNSSNLGVTAYQCDARVPYRQFGECLLRLCSLLSPATFLNLRKAVPPKAAVLSYIPGFDANQLLHRVKLLFFTVEEHISSATPESALGPANLPNSTKPVSSSSQSPTRGGVALRTSATLWGRDSFLTMSAMALHYRRQAVVDPRVFREKSKMVIALFVRFSNWASSERWQVIEERRMSPSLFSSLCAVTGILGHPASSHIRAIASRLPSLGWQTSTGARETGAAAEYARVSPVYDLLNTTVATAAADRKAAKRMVSAIQRSKRDAVDDKAALHVKRCLLSASRGLDASLLRPVDPTVAAMIFSVVSLSRSTCASLAQNKIFQMTGSGAPSIDRYSATVDSEGFCEEDATETLSMESTLGFAGFCELIAFLSEQCVAHPWMSSSARTALFVEYVYGAVFE